MPNILVFATPPNNLDNSNKTLNCNPPPTVPIIKTTNTSLRQLIMHTVRYEYMAGGIGCSSIMIHTPPL